MGRSQLKYRPTRGRGQGDSARGGRGGGPEKTGGGRGGGGRGSRSGGRPLESNAFRYEERNEREDEEEDTTTDVAMGHSSSRQFFAEERQYRDMGDVKESYFRTKAMQQWDADDDEGEEATGTVGIMDFAWIAEQLTSVPLSLRFQIDPKYCVNFASEEPVEEDSEDPSPSHTTSERIVDTTSHSTPDQAASVPGSELDELLAVSSAAATTSSGQTSLPANATSVVVAVESAATGSGEQENLEDWLDDVLDM